MANRIPKLIKMTVFLSRKRRGDINRIAEDTMYSPSYVSRVTRGLRHNETILSHAYRISYRRIKNSERA